MTVKFISTTTSAYIIYSFFTIAVVYHLSVIIGTVPLNMAWGGRLNSQMEMYVFEALSISINLLLVLLAAIRVKHVSCKMNERMLHSLLWVCVIVFILNTIGNIQAINKWEAIIFTPITALSAILFARLALRH